MTCNENFITTHYNSLQSITIQHKPGPICIIIATKPLQLITIHYNPLQTNSCFFHHPCQAITIHYNPLQSITIDSKSPFKPLPYSPSHSRNSPLKDKNHLIMKISLRFSLRLYPNRWGRN